MKCFISKNYRHIESAGDKAKTDIEAVMLKLGYRNIGLPQHRKKNVVAAFLITLVSEMTGLLRLRKGDTLVVQYPLKKYYDFIVRTARGRGVSVITVIHDLGSFRRKKLTVEQEVARLNRSAVIIAHTPAMRQWLIDNGVRVPIVVLGMFDFLSDTQAQDAMGGGSPRTQLMFAGNLSPAYNRWLYLLAKAEPGIDLALYGEGIDANQSTPNIKAMGTKTPEQLIAASQGDYGVAWYGDTLDGGNGKIGDYIQYNAPHKISLYLRAGKPVITWDKAAMAPIITNLGIGISVSTLEGIGKALSEVSAEQYAAMRERVAEVSARLAEGSFISEALALATALIADD